MNELKLTLEVVPLPLQKPDAIKARVTINMSTIVDALGEADKHRLILKLLAEVYHNRLDSICNGSDWYANAINSELEAIRKAAGAAKFTYRQRIDWSSCGLSEEDAKLFGFDVP